MNMIFKNSKMSDKTPVNLANEINGSSDNSQMLSSALKNKEESNTAYPDVQVLATVACREFPEKDAILPSTSTCGDDVAFLQSDNSQISFNSSCSLDNTKLIKKRKRPRKSVYWRNKKRKTKKKNSSNNQLKPVDLSTELTNEKIDSDSSDTIILDDTDLESNIQKSCNGLAEDEGSPYLGKLLPSKGMTPGMLACYISLPKLEESDTQISVPKNHSYNKQLNYIEYSNRTESGMFTKLEGKNLLPIKTEEDSCLDDTAPLLIPIKQEIDDSVCDATNELPPVLQHVPSASQVIPFQNKNSSKCDILSGTESSSLHFPVVQNNNGNIDCNIAEKTKGRSRGRGKTRQIRGRSGGRKGSRSNANTTQTICSDAKFDNFLVPSELEAITDPSLPCKNPMECSPPNFNQTVSRKSGKSRTVKNVQRNVQRQKSSADNLGKDSMKNAKCEIQTRIPKLKTEANKAYVFMSFEEDVSENHDDSTYLPAIKIKEGIHKSVCKENANYSSVLVNDNEKQIQLLNTSETATPCSSTSEQKGKFNNKNSSLIKAKRGLSVYNFNSLKIKKEIIDYANEESVLRNKSEANYNRHISAKINETESACENSAVNASCKQLTGPSSLLGMHNTSNVMGLKLLNLESSENILSRSEKQIPVNSLNSIKIKKEPIDDTEKLSSASEKNCNLDISNLTAKRDMCPSESAIPNTAFLLNKHFDVENKNSNISGKFQEQKLKCSIASTQNLKLSEDVNSVSHFQNKKCAENVNICYIDLESEKEISNISGLPIASNAASIPASDSSNKKDKTGNAEALKSTNKKQSILCSLLTNAKSPSPNLPFESAMQKSSSDLCLPPIVSVKKEPVDEEIPLDSSRNYLFNLSSCSESNSNKLPENTKAGNAVQSILEMSGSSSSIQSLQSCEKVDLLQIAPEASLNTSSSSTFPIKIKQEPPDTDNASFQEVSAFNRVKPYISNTGHQSPFSGSGSNSHTDAFSSQQSVLNASEIPSIPKSVENILNTLNYKQSSISTFENISNLNSHLCSDNMQFSHSTNLTDSHTDIQHKDFSSLLPSAVQIKKEPCDDNSVGICVFNQTSTNERIVSESPLPEVTFRTQESSSSNIRKSTEHASQINQTYTNERIVSESPLPEVTFRTQESSSSNIRKSTEHASQIFSDDSNSLLFAAAIKKEPCDDASSVEEIPVFQKGAVTSENKECISNSISKVSLSENISGIYKSSDAESSIAKQSVTGHSIGDISGKSNSNSCSNSESDVVSSTSTEVCKNDTKQLNNVPSHNTASLGTLIQSIESESVNSCIQESVGKKSLICDSNEITPEVSQSYCLPSQESQSLAVNTFTSPVQSQIRIGSDEQALHEISCNEKSAVQVSSDLNKEESLETVKSSYLVSDSVSTCDISHQCSSIDSVSDAKDIPLLHGNSLSSPKLPSEETKLEKLSLKEVPSDNYTANLEKKYKSLYRYPYPADASLGPLRRKHRCRSNLYARINPLSLNLSLEEVVSRLRCAENKTVTFQNESEDTVKLIIYPLMEAEAECYHRILGIAPSQKLLSKCYKPSKLITADNENFPKVGFLPVSSSDVDDKGVPSLQANVNQTTVYGKFFENFNPDEVCEDIVKYSNPKQGDSSNLVEEKGEVSDQFKTFPSFNSGQDKEDFVAGVNDFKVSEPEKLSNLFSDLAQKFNSLTNNSIKIDNIGSRVSEVAYCTKESYMNLDAYNVGEVLSDNSNSFVQNLEIGMENKIIGPSTENKVQQDLECTDISKDMLYSIIQSTQLTSVDNFMPPNDQTELSAAISDNKNTYSDSPSVVNNPLQPVIENYNGLFVNNDIAKCNNLKEQDTAWPDSTVSNKCLDKIDIPISELLKIVQTAESLPSNLIQNSISSDTADYTHNEAINSRDRMLLKNATLNYNHYDLNYSDVIDQSVHSKIPIIHEYDHKPARFCDDSISNITPDKVCNESANKTSNDIPVSDPENLSDNGADYIDVDVSTRSDEEDNPVKQPSCDEKELPKSEPKYKSRWEKIMERKTVEPESRGKGKLNEHLLKECFPVSETISGKLCKKSTKSELTNSIKKSNSLDVSKNLKRTNPEKGYQATFDKSKKLKKNKNRRPKKGYRNQKCVTNKTATFMTPSLFSPDKVVKKFDPQKEKMPDSPKITETREKPGDSHGKRFYGNRVTNRGSFLTQSSVSQPPKLKKLQYKSNSKNNAIRIKTDEFHSMVQSPEIEIISDRNKPRIRTEDKHRIAQSAETDMFRHRSVLNNPSYERVSEFSYDTKNARKPVSYPVYRRKVNYFDRVDPLYSSANPAKHIVNNAILNTPSSNFPETYLPNRPKIQEVPPVPCSLVINPLKASTQFNKEHFIEGINMYKNSSRSDPRLQPYNSRAAPISPEIITDRLMPVFQTTQPNASPIDFGFDTPSLSNPVLVGAPLPIPATQTTQSSQQQSARLKTSRCICLPPRHMKASVGEKIFETINVLLLILEWNVDWLVQQQRNHDPPPISKLVKKVKNSYESMEDYYNTYFPLLLLETWQRIYVSWTRLHQATPYFCEITSYTVETHYINVECRTVYKSSDVDRGIFPEEGNIIVVKFATVGKGGIKILGYVTHVKVKHFNPEMEPDNVCYKTLKYSAGDQLQMIKLSFKGAYSSEDFDKKQLIRIQVLCNIKSTLKQNDALLNLQVSPLYANILNPLEDGLRTVALAARHLQKAADKVSECVREVMKGILSPHPLPLLTVVKSLPSSDRLLILPQLVERMKSSYATKVLLCTRTTKALTDIGFNLEDSEVKVVIIGKRGDVHQKLRKYMLDDLAAADISAKSGELSNENKTHLSKEQSKSELLLTTKKRIISECDVILSQIRNCHDELIVQACAEFDHIAHMCCIIDEANLCTEPEILIPLLYGISKLILIGDPDIPAKVCSKTANSYDYNRSLFHRAYDLDLIED